MNKKILISRLILTAILMGINFSMAIADDGHKWLESAPAFCRSKPYSNLTPKQMSICDEAAFRHLSKNWKTITASNGQAYEIALDTITSPLPPNSDAGAKLRGAMVLVYIYEGITFNSENVLRFYFDCHDRFQTFTSDWSSVEYMPPFSVVAEISSLACKSNKI